MTVAQSRLCTSKICSASIHRLRTIGLCVLQTYDNLSGYHMSSISSLYISVKRLEEILWFLWKQWLFLSRILDILILNVLPCRWTMNDWVITERVVQQKESVKSTDKSIRWRLANVVWCLRRLFILGLKWKQNYFLTEPSVKKSLLW